jgi:hypothetical protein
MLPTGGGYWSPLVDEFIDSGRPAGPEKMGLGWGFQILPYLEEDAIHGLETQSELGATVVPIYVCPSRRGIMKKSFVEFGEPREYTMAEYAGIHPCTKIWTSDANPLDLTVPPNPGTVRNYFVKPVTDQPGYSDDPTAQNACPPANGVYDGVIVRSPWRADRGNYDYQFQKMAGVFVSNVPMPVRTSKVSDGMSKTMMIGEKYIYQSVYQDITPSDDRGWTDGWDADTMRCTCIRPMSDSDCDGARDAGAHGPCPPDAEHNSSWYTLGLGSAHASAFNAVYSDGSVHSINYDIDLFVLNALGTRNGTSAGPKIGSQIGSEVAIQDAQ